MCNIDTTGLNERFLFQLRNGDEYFEVRQYWTPRKYIQYTEFYRNIFYEPLPKAFHDLYRALFWLCKEAAKDIDHTLRTFHSAKIWNDVLAQYESANPEAPNYKSFEQQLGSSPTTIGEFPLNKLNMRDPLKLYRDALRLFADRVLTFHSRFIRNESGFVLSRIINCH